MFVSTVSRFSKLCAHNIILFIVVAAEEEAGWGGTRAAPTQPARLTSATAQRSPRSLKYGPPAQVHTNTASRGEAHVVISSLKPNLCREFYQYLVWGLIWFNVSQAVPRTTAAAVWCWATNTRREARRGGPAAASAAARCLPSARASAAPSHAPPRAPTPCTAPARSPRHPTRTRSATHTRARSPTTNQSRLRTVCEVLTSWRPWSSLPNCSQ